MSKYLWKAITLLCLLALLVGCSKDSALKASRIYDGDSLVLSNGQEIRLIGIDAPEKGQRGADEARDYLKGLITGKELRIEKGVEEYDKYNRLLVYLYAGDTFVNAEMIKQGYAVAYFVPPRGLSGSTELAEVPSKANDKYKEEFTKLEADAKKSKKGLWAGGDIIPPHGTKKFPPREIIVYVTVTAGDKYHQADCPHLKGRETKEITLSEAIGLNKKPCKNCNPPTEEGK